MSADVIIGFNTLILPILQHNTLAKGVKPAQKTLVAWFSETKAAQPFNSAKLGAIFKNKDGNSAEQWRLRIAVVSTEDE